MKIVKNIIATLLGIGMIFVGGETVGLRARATSIEAPVPATSIVAITTGVSGDETTTTTDTTTTTETERPTALGEGVTDIVTTESPTNSGTNVSASSAVKEGGTRTETTVQATGSTTRLSAWFETSVSTSADSPAIISSATSGTIEGTSDTIGSTITTTSTTTTEISGAPKTSDPSGVGAVCMLIAAGVIGGLLMINGKKE